MKVYRVPQQTRLQPVRLFGLLALLLGVTTTRRSAPAHDYAEAAVSIERRQVADDSVVMPGGRSIFMSQHRRTPRVYVLLHGFTDSPRQFEELGAWLAARGDNVYIPRLPHHAERKGVGELGRVRVAELVAFGDSAVDVARGLGDTVTVIGLSVGGAIGGWIAEHRPDVFRVVLVAPALAPGRISTGSAEETNAIAELIGRLPGVTRASAPDTTRPDFVQGISTRGLSEVMKLGSLVRQEAEKMPSKVARIVMLLNENDHTVSGEASVALAKLWSESSSLVLLYQFPVALGLPHNLMESTARGGKLELVHPVLQALALGTAPPSVVRFDWVNCTSPGCH
jgi:alpha-beta hydrolase superfamily lysophospholipase